MEIAKVGKLKVVELINSGLPINNGQARALAKHSHFKPRESHGQMTDAVKDTLNQWIVRTILKNKYGIGKKEIKMLDKTGPFKIELLSERRCLGGLDLPPTAGLVINSRKGSGFPVTTISSEGHDLNETGPEFFAFCIKKAYDMVELYRTGVKDFSKHKINKELHYKSKQLERPLKAIINDVKAAYIRSDDEAMNRATAKIARIRVKTAEINENAKVDREIAQKELHNTVIAKWKEIQKTTFAADTEEDIAKNKAKAKRERVGRQMERQSKFKAYDA